MNQNKNTQEVREELFEFVWRGPKVADCVLLFSTLKDLKLFQ